MHYKKTISGFLFGFTLFIGITPLAFIFSQKGTQPLLETPFEYVVWCGQGLELLLLLLTSQNLSKNQLMGLSSLFIFVPLTFTVNENGVSFLILNQYASSILSWAIASVMLGKLLFVQQWNENAHF